MFRGTRSSIEMLKGYTDGESLGTPALEKEVKGRKVWWTRGPLHMISSSNPVRKSVMQPISNSCSKMGWGPILLKPVWKSFA